jgi:hypothetical protein
MLGDFQFNNRTLLAEETPALNLQLPTITYELEHRLLQRTRSQRPINYRHGLQPKVDILMIQEHKLRNVQA